MLELLQNEQTVTFIANSSCSLILGLILAVSYTRLNTSSSGYAMAVFLLPMVIQTMVMLISGSIGTGIAIAGAFGLVRFRSIQIRPEEIILLLAGTVIGVADAAGAYVISALFTVFVIAFLFVGHFFKLTADHKILTVVMPEGINHSVLDPVLNYNTNYHSLISVRTTNMGSLYKLTYDVVLSDMCDEQSFIDDLRIRNGNLEISLNNRADEMPAC